MALSGLAYLVQGWVVGSDGFPHAESLAIVATYALHLAWPTWLVRTAYRAPDAKAPSQRARPAPRPCTTTRPG